MKIFIDCEGSIAVSSEHLDKEYVELECDEGAPIKLVPLDHLVYLVRFNGSTNVKLIIFRDKKNRTPRIIDLENVPDYSNVRLTNVRIFYKLLTYDAIKLSQRDRNIAVTIIRNILPAVIRGEFSNSQGNGVLGYYLNNEMLSIFKGSKRLAHLPYTSFSRNIKDSLCSTN